METYQKQPKLTVYKNNYKLGEILVGFDEGTTQAQAEEFIESLDYDNELDIQPRRYIRLRSSVVNVPEGKEMDYACYFNSMADDTIIKYGGLNHIYKIQPRPRPPMPKPQEK